MTGYEDEIEAWRAARAKRVSAADGWLALVARVQLHEGANAVGSDPRSEVVLPASAPARVATLHLEQGRVRIEVGAGVDLSVGGDTVAAPDDARQGTPNDARLLTADDVVVLGALRMQILVRGDDVFLRVRDEASPARLAFTGIPYFPVDRRWRVEARLERLPERIIELPYAEGGFARYPSPGVAVFEIEGRERRLPVMFERGEPRVLFLFKDLTNGKHTYGAGRFLYAPLPEHDRLVLDFNMAFNPPCALTEFASCPIIPADGRLDVGIEAGEKTPK